MTLSSKKIKYSCIYKEVIKKFNTFTEANEEGFWRAGVKKCCESKRNDFKGYKWSYAN